MTVSELIEELQEIVGADTRRADYEVRDREGSAIGWANFDDERGVLEVLPSPLGADEL